MSNKLDRLVAERVMNYRPWRNRISASDGYTYYDGSARHRWEDDVGPTKHYWSPSSDISAAWEVLAKFTDATIEKSGNMYTVCINAVEGFDPSAAKAICKCAAFAVGVPESEITEAMQ